MADAQRSDVAACGDMIAVVGGTLLYYTGWASSIEGAIPHFGMAPQYTTVSPGRFLYKNIEQKYYIIYR